MKASCGFLAGKGARSSHTFEFSFRRNDSLSPHFCPEFLGVISLFVDSSRIRYSNILMKQTPLPKTWLFFFVVIVVLVIGAMLQLSIDSSSSKVVPAGSSSEIRSSSNMTDRQKNAENMAAKGGNTVYLENQTAGQSTVKIGFAMFADSGFVVIHEDNNGTPGKIIGSSALIRKRADQIMIQISPPLKKDQVYYAALHRDNGDATFKETDNRFLDDTDGDVTLMSFLATE